MRKTKQAEANKLQEVVIDIQNRNAEFIVKIKNGKCVLSQVILRPEVIEWGYEDGIDLFEIKFNQKPKK